MLILGTWNKGNKDFYLYWGTVSYFKGTRQQVSRHHLQISKMDVPEKTQIRLSRVLQLWLCLMFPQWFEGKTIYLNRETREQRIT